ncbi:MAG: alpha/beta hydrolase [Elusimicrobia bacterium]|nr:alpha/beta hydrolase [Elusimicrobiota bacterium]
MSLRRLILFSGMGGDARLFAKLQLTDIETLAPDHVEPLPKESLREYAARLMALHAVGPQDVVGGVSFGGMLAAEIASQRKVSGLILLGSCRQPSRLPWSYAWFERGSRVLPGFLFRVRTWSPVLRWRFAPVDRNSAASIAAMAAKQPTRRLRAFGRMAVQWPGAPAPSCPTLSMHGDRDRIIPIRCADPDVILEDAGHAFTLTHPESTSAAIRDFLRNLPD